MSSGGSRRGLEFLIRKSGPGGESGFEIKVYRADRAFLGMRPSRRADVAVELNRIEEATGRVYMLHLLESDRHLRLTETEYAVWTRMDGHHSIQDLATALVIEHGSFDFDAVTHALGRFRGAGLIDERRPGLLRTRPGEDASPVRSLARSLAEFDHRWEDVDGMFDRLARWLGPLVSRRALPIAALFGLVGLVVYAATRFSGQLGGDFLPLWAHLLMFFLLAPVFLAVHELAHGLACKAHGRRVRAVGISMLDHVLPSVYVDVTDMFMASRDARILVAVAGPLANLCTAAAATLLALWVQHPVLDAVLLVVADVNLGLAIYTFWPFSGLQQDGYDALSELFGITLLRRRALAWLGGRFGKGSKALPIPTRTALIYLGGVAATWIVALSLLFAWLLLPGR